MRTTLKVYLERGEEKDYFFTFINLPKEEAIKYYLCKWLNIGRGEHDYYMRCYKVDILKEEEFKNVF